MGRWILPLGNSEISVSHAAKILTEAFGQAFAEKRTWAALITGTTSPAWGPGQRSSGSDQHMQTKSLPTLPKQRRSEEQFWGELMRLRPLPEAFVTLKGEGSSARPSC